VARAGVVGVTSRLARRAAGAARAACATPAGCSGALGGMLFAACAAAQVGAGPPDADGHPTLNALHSDAECAVWARERSFAASVERHDAEAFAEHLHAGAVFNAGDFDATRGREAVARSWSRIVEGRDVVLRWWPGVVQIGGAPDVALSRGPYLLELPALEPAHRWRVGEFQSVWLRDRDTGTWRVLYDMSAVPPLPVESLEAAQRWVAARRTLACGGR
jgi:ketosteroid isomerase-like protein